ncbi:MAG TPA: metal-dependent hydrolase [Pyrinomonadaceae bacterium]|jgi:inner membrane protein
MPTIFSHAVFAVVAGKAFLKKRVSFWFWILTAVCAIVPDADVIGYSFGVERGGMFAHRGFTHSIFFAVSFGALAAWIARRFLKTPFSFAKMIVFFALATVSHPLLDMLTNGGSGVALLAPFSNQRFASPWRPIEVSPIGLRFFSERGRVVIVSEFFWVWLPAAAIFVLALIFRKGRK